MIKYTDEVVTKIITTYNEDDTFNILVTTGDDYKLEEFHNLTMETVESAINGKSSYIKVSTIEEV